MIVHPTRKKPRKYNRTYEYIAEPKPILAKWQLYVLELEDGCFYIGIAIDVQKRFQEHVTGLGANFTRQNKPIRVFETTCCGTEDRDVAYKMESEKTLEYALKFGGDKVKGGKYFIPSKLIKKVKLLRSANIIT
jgi:predicted GIY-YIG superfamily endonuclease